jgi:hypothetical protein
MATTVTHWRDALIAKSETISDAWQVFLAYAGRAAEVVLFGCMVISLVQMVPTMHLWQWLTDGTLIVQMITLDIAGFGLNSMAKHVKRAGDEETAQKAETTGNFLIGIMIVSLLSVTVKQMFGKSAPVVDEAMTYVDYTLILIRVVMTVVYGHVIHSLRESKQHIQAQQEEKREDLQGEIDRLQQALQDEERQASETKAELTHTMDQLSYLQESLNQSLQNGTSMQASMTEMELAMQAKLQATMQAARLQMQAEMKAQQEKLQAEAQATQVQLQAEIADLKRANVQLKAQQKEQVKAPVKPELHAVPGKFDAREFVFSCLHKSPDLKLAEIAKLASMQGQELSETTISRYRKEYRESSTVVKNESSAM